mgnify:CR=1 FL=1
MAITKAQKTKKPIQKQQKFLKDVKSGKYGKVEKSNIVYSRMSERSQPYEVTRQTRVYYGIH